MTDQPRPRSPLPRRPGVSLYAALVEQLQALIAGADLHPGDALPSETELQTAFGVSRATVRQALAILEQRGEVDRHQGRGTFVALPAMERDLAELTSFSEHVSSRGMRPSSRLVECRTVVADTDSDARHFAAGTPLVRVVRVRLANDVAVGVHTAYLPMEVAARIGFTEEVLRTDSSVSMYALLDRGGIHLAHADEHLRARLADATEVRLLEVRRPIPVMSVLRKSYDQRSRLVEVVRAVYLGHKYDYVVQLDRGTGVVGTGGLVTTGSRDRPEEEMLP